MSVVCIDNFLPSEYVSSLRSTVLLDNKHSFNMSSNGIIPFYSVEFNINDPLVQKLVNQINSVNSTLYSVKRAYANIQYSGMDGTWHTDDGDVTALIFLNEKIQDGNFEIRIKTNEETVTEEYSPDPGRLLLFEGRHLHRGLSSTTLAIPRISLAFKLWR